MEPLQKSVLCVLFFSIFLFCIVFYLLKETTQELKLAKEARNAQETRLQGLEAQVSEFRRELDQVALDAERFDEGDSDSSFARSSASFSESFSEVSSPKQTEKRKAD